MMKATTDLEQIKENMQEVGNRIKHAFERLEIPIENIKSYATVAGPAGVFLEWVDLDEFIQKEMQWHQENDLCDCKSYRDLCALWNTVDHIRKGLSNDLQLLFNLTDQFSLVQANKLQATKDRLVLKAEPLLPPDKPGNHKAPVMPEANGVADGSEAPEPKPKRGVPVKLVDDEDEEEGDAEESDEEE